jgi:hypothetical protein
LKKISDNYEAACEYICQSLDIEYTIENGNKSLKHSRISRKKENILFLFWEINQIIKRK